MSDAENKSPAKRVWNTVKDYNKAGDRYICFTGEGHIEIVARIDDVDEDMLQKLLEIANHFYS